MVTVLCMDVEPGTLAHLQRHRRPPILSEAVGPEHVIATLKHDPTATEALVLGKDVDEPLKLVHHAHALDEDLAVVVLASPDKLEPLRDAIEFLPSLRGDVSCTDAEDLEGLCLTIEEAAKRTQKRRILRAMSSSARANHTGSDLPLAAPFLVRLLDHSPVGIVVLNAQGTVQLCNPRALELLELKEVQAIGRSLVLLFPEEEWSDLSHFLAHCTATERKQPGRRFLCSPPSGHERWVEVSAVPFPGAKGERGTLIFLEDRGL